MIEKENNKIKDQNKIYKVEKKFNVQIKNIWLTYLKDQNILL